MDKSHDGGRPRKATKRIWSRPMKPHSVRLNPDEARKLRQLVKQLRISQSRVFARALDHYHRAVTASADE